MSAAAASGGGPVDYLEEDQDRYLEEAKSMVRQHAFHMKRAMDADELKEALKFASNMLSELRTSLLSPKNYYELYMMVTDEMRHLEAFVTELSRKKSPTMSELYEMVQHAGNVVPRLYLLCTVGGVYIKSKQVSAREILRDLVEMCKGVQHPMRGLFLRNFLSQMCKDKLPDTGSEYEGAGGTVQDAIDFVLQNFGEMNRLWVRMQHQGRVRDRAKRERERQDLRILVGTNLFRLSQLDGVTLEVYRTSVLPRVLEQVVECRDRIAQQYLMECLVQVFPDEFHLATLDALIATLTQLREEVDVRSVIIMLMDRLGNYADSQVSAGHARESVLPAETNAFGVFSDFAAKLLELRTDMDVSDMLGLQVALLGFAVKCYPGRTDLINGVLGFSAGLLSRVVGSGKVNEACTELVTQLLELPQNSLAMEVLSLDNYPALMGYLSWAPRRQVAVRLLQAVLAKPAASSAKLDNPDALDRLLSFIRPLVRDDDDAPSDESRDATEFEQEQVLVARLANLLRAPSTDLQYALYAKARTHFGTGGTRRIQYTLPPLVYGMLRLAPQIRARELAGEQTAVRSKKVFQFVHETLTVLASRYQMVALRTFLHAAAVADRLREEAIAYEFVSQAFVLYEDIADSKVQLATINYIIGAIYAMRNFGEENFPNLAARAAQYAAKLLKRPDQCRMVQLCAHLFWSPAEGVGVRENKRVLECLQRALKIADSCTAASAHVQLFVEILNEYVYFFEQSNPAVLPKFVNGLIALIREHLDTIDAPEVREPVSVFFRNTLAHIRGLKSRADTAERFAEVSIE